MARSLSPQLTESSSSLVMRLALLMRTWIRRRSSGSGSNPDLINSWIVGSLDSAWRAIEQYLTIHDPDLLWKFHKRWGSTEHWDEPSDHERLEDKDDLSVKVFSNQRLAPGKSSADSYHGLLERHLAIALHNDGIEPGSELPIPREVLEELERANATA